MNPKRKINPPTHYSEWVNDEIEYVIEFSQSYPIYLDPKFHPYASNKVPWGTGWRAVTLAKWRGQESRGAFQGQLSKTSAEELARQNARWGLDLSSFNEGPYVDDGTGKFVKNPFTPLTSV